MKTSKYYQETFPPYYNFFLNKNTNTIELDEDEEEKHKQFLKSFNKVFSTKTNDSSDADIYEENKYFVKKQNPNEAKSTIVVLIENEER